MAGTGCCVVLLVAHLAGDAEGAHACGDRVECLGRCFGKAGDRCLARHRVDGRLLRANALERREPRADVLLAGVIESRVTSFEDVTNGIIFIKGITDRLRTRSRKQPAAEAVG